MQGPFENPFKAVVKALNEANIDSSELTTYRLWDAVAYYPFHSEADDFIPSLLEWFESLDIHVEHRDDGFYAEYLP